MCNLRGKLATTLTALVGASLPFWRRCSAPVTEMRERALSHSDACTRWKAAPSSSCSVPRSWSVAQAATATALVDINACHLSPPPPRVWGQSDEGTGHLPKCDAAGSALRGSLLLSRFKALAYGRVWRRCPNGRANPRSSSCVRSANFRGLLLCCAIPPAFIAHSHLSVNPAPRAHVSL